MKASYNWLKEFVDFNTPPDELAHILTMAGFEVEAVEKTGDDTVLDIAVTPNRPDCLSIRGIAREISAVLELPFRDISVELKNMEGEKKFALSTASAAGAATATRLTAALSMGTATAAAIGSKFRKLIRTGLPDFDHIHIKTESFAGQRMIEINRHGVIYGIHLGHTDHDRAMGAMGLKGHAGLDLDVIRELFHGDVLKQVLTDRPIRIFRLNDDLGTVTNFHAHESIFQAGNNLS